MTKTYAQIVKQIDSLKQVAEKLRRGEVDGVIKRIREAISFYSLTASDLGLNLKAKRGPGKAASPIKRRRGKAAAKSLAVIKFSNGAGGTWVGRGKRPQWLRDQINSGKQLSDFAVK